MWPEVPAPLYYYEDERFRTYVNGLARLTRAYLLIGIVAHTPDGAPLNSATLVSPSGAPIRSTGDSNTQSRTTAWSRAMSAAWVPPSE